MKAVCSEFFYFYKTNKIKCSKKIKLNVNDNFYIFQKLEMIGNILIWKLDPNVNHITRYGNFSSHLHAVGVLREEGLAGAVFLFSLFTKIYFRFQNLQEYTPAALLSGDRDLVAPLRGSRGFSAKNFAKNLR